MDAERRTLLKAAPGAGLLAVLAGLGLLDAGAAWAEDWNKAAFGTTSVADTIKQLGGTDASASGDVLLTAPDIAENGAVVPLTIASNLPKTQRIAVLVEKNPNTLAANFGIPEGTEAAVSTRIKMGQTCNVIALVQADGKFYSASKEVKVTLGGCGG